MSSQRRLQRSILFVALLAAGSAFGAGAAIDCAKPLAGSIEALVCGDAELLAFDRALAAVYGAALKKAGNERPPVLKAEQRGWIKGRNDCWKSDDKRACVVDAYRRRIVELQARYRLVAASPPVRYICNGNAADEVIATYFRTDPPTLIAERGDQTSLMFQERSASGTRYVGRNELLWEHQGQATIRWGYDAPEMLCAKDDTEGKPPSLVGTSWRLRAMQSMDDAQGTTTIPEAQRYTVHFAADGRAVLRLDCNRGSAPWSAATGGGDSGSLRFGMLATTRAMCPPGSLDQKIAQQLGDVRSYLFKDGWLYMSLLADGGILQWEALQQGK